MYNEPEVPVAYILCYRLKKTRLTTTKVFRSGTKPKISETTKEIFSDHYEVFCEYDEMGSSPQEQANDTLNGIKASLDNEETDTELDSWNICKVMSTSEHYEAEKPCTLQAAWEHEKSALAEGNELADSEYQEIPFNSRSEAEAFMKGVDEGNGWDAPFIKIKETKLPDQ